MKKHILYSFVLWLFIAGCSIEINAQESIALGYFQVDEVGKEPIGFANVDLSYSALRKQHFDVNLGARLGIACAGQRGGFFYLGYLGEGLYKMNDWFSLGLQGSFSAGGGASAPDKDGWILQSGAFLQIGNRSRFALRAGYVYSYVSSGKIKGYSPMLSLNFKLQAKETQDLKGFENLSWNSFQAESGVGLFENKRLAFVGAAANYSFGKYLGGDFAVVALVNTYGGYMQSLLGLGPQISGKRLQFGIHGVVGAGGGGGVKSGGGGLYGAQAKLSVKLGKWLVGIKGQRIQALSKKYNYDGLFLSFGKQLGNELKVDISPAFKCYLGSNSFGNIGARIKALSKGPVKFYLGTYWACTDNRGAYAEGLFEGEIYPFKFPLYTVVSLGAGAGAGINGGTSAIIYSAGIGYTLPWDKLPLSFECSYWDGGNIPNASLTVLYRFERP